ncbi:MAG TPA: sugar ABC transporter permease [Candidatus Mediterraneibacter faecavium]|uniref:Sugar ABC transporter permease n=1 Tax=Candidatus Mediterraneibacter faecavium TaxID=2838668 RepID=A0A9D2TMB5_9FIRM|nr:sugar ABC transporter permease [Candidatus Mediterraneibacter faecavium]
MKYKKKLYGKRFIIPAFVLYTILFVIPSVAGMVISLTDWNVAKPDIHFIGLQNFVDIFTSKGGQYLGSIIHTLEFTFVTVIFKTVLGLGLALLLFKGLRSQNVFRTIFFTPYALAPVIIGISFISVLKPEGPFNAVLEAVGLGALTHSWLSDPNTALGSTMAVEIWRMAGWNMMILLAGMQMIPEEYYEASSIDGATKWKQFWKITLPFLRPSLMTVIVLNTIHGLRTFDIVFALTGGGPGGLTELINTQVFKEFGMGRYGMANALNVVIFVVTVVIAVIMQRLLTGKENNE